MPRLTKTENIDGVEYTVHRGTRLERGQAVYLYNRITEINNRQEKKLPLLVDDVELYCSTVVYADVSGLKTVDNTPVPLPDYLDDDAVHLHAYALFLDVEPDITDAIGEAISEINKPTAPREILPPEDLTEEEKADADFLADGKKPSKT